MRTSLATLLLTLVQLPALAATLDDFSSRAAWRAATSEDVQASIAFGDGTTRTLRLNYDFGAVSGFAAATRALPIDFPDNFEITLRVRGIGPANELQLKFVDASGDNVWWYRRSQFEPSADWQTLRIKKRHVEFAWGPTGDRSLPHTERLEFVVNSAMGGRGYLEFEQLSLTPLPKTVDEPYSYSATATSQIASAPAALAVDGKADTTWISASGGAQTLTIYLGEPREFGGMQIDWLKEQSASQYTIQLSDDLKTWRTVRTVDSGNGNRDEHFLPDSEARAVRLLMYKGPNERYGISELRLTDVSTGASPNAFFRSIAASKPRGWYPRGITGEQSYWTVIGTEEGAAETLVGEDGALEGKHAGFSLEPFIKLRDTVSWADVTPTHLLKDGYLPIPTITWRHPQFELEITAVADGNANASRTVASYRVTNKTTSPQTITLALGIRPFQVNPPAQFLGQPGGVSPIYSLRREGDHIVVNDALGVLLIDAPSEFGAGQFDEGNITEWLQSAPLHREVRDEIGFASGLLQYRLELQPGGSKTVSVALPLDGTLIAPTSTSEQTLFRVATRWAQTLDRVRFTIPPEAQALVDTIKTSHAHILINRDGPALQPGSRAYARSWIRDGAMEADTLLRLGDFEPAKEFLTWFAPRLFANGKVPCCVDQRGSDPVPENDSAGEFVFLVADIFRYTHDIELLKETWPQVQKAMAYLEILRLKERTPAILDSKDRAFYGLVPASISHEGYSAKPMHSYWDDFWTMKGYDAAVDIAAALKDRRLTETYRHSRDEFRADLRRSLEQAMRDSDIRFLPGSAELGDFDATSTSIAVSPAGDTRLLPDSSLIVTFERYWAQFVARERSQTWEDYTPYELRNVATFAHLGWRERAASLLDFFMKDRRPANWNQWAEVVGREVRKERFIGDMPHAWVGSDYIRSVLDLFAYERSEDRSLVLMAGIPSSWFANGFGIEKLRTPYGELSYSVRAVKKKLRVEISGIAVPPGGLFVDWPADRSHQRTTVIRGRARWQDGKLLVSALPVVVELPR